MRGNPIARTAMLADAVREARSAANEPVIGRGDVGARLADAFARARQAGGHGDADARAALLSLGVAYGEGDSVTCHGEPLIVPEAPAPWAACQVCGGRYGLMTLAKLAPSMAAKVEGE